MGRLWDSFRERFAGVSVPEPEPVTPAPVAAAAQPAPEPEKRFELKRAYTAEPLSSADRAELEEVRNLPGYEILRAIMERTCEGFVSALVNTDPKDKEAVLARHMLAHAAWKHYESVQLQVDAEININRIQREETRQLEAQIEKALNPKMPDLSDPDTLNRLLDPTYVPDSPATEPIDRVTVIQPKDHPTALEQMLAES